MIHNVSANSVQEIMPTPVQSGGQGSRSSACAGVDATLQIRYAPLVAEALQTADSDAEAVRRATELLASGELESIENIREAAQDLLDLGD